MVLFHNANITDINAICEQGLLPASVSRNYNWESNKRADNSEDVVYLFSPKSKKNTFTEYGICLIEVDIDNANENELACNDKHSNDYTEYVTDQVSPEQIKAIYIPEIFKSRIKEYTELSEEALNKIVWCDMEAEIYDKYIPNPDNEYGFGGTHIYKKADSKVLEKFVETAPLNVTYFNYFRGVDDNREMIEMHNVIYIRKEG